MDNFWESEPPDITEEPGLTLIDSVYHSSMTKTHPCNVQVRKDGTHPWSKRNSG